MKKIFMLDTSVIMRNPKCFYVFEDNDVAISEITLEELDSLKEQSGERGYHARQAINEIFNIKSNNYILPDGGTFKIVDGVGPEDISKMNVQWSPSKNDNIIIYTAKKNNAILVTADTAMLIKAEAIGVEAQRYYNEEASSASLSYMGYRELVLDNDLVQKFYEKGEIDYPDNNLVPNEYLILKTECGLDAGLAKYDGSRIISLKFKKAKPFGISARNTLQTFAIDALMDTDIPLVILKGPAGTAKTFLSLACALEYTMEKNIFRKAIMLKPAASFSESLGLLPGSEEEKVTPHLRPILDNLEVLLAKNGDNQEEIQSKIDFIMDKKYLKFESMEFMRGRSLASTLLFVDEAQNTTPEQMLGLLTRAGINSKIVITGDPAQIDAKNLGNTKENNGLVFAASRMCGSPLCAQITFSDEECVRSALSKEAAQRLSNTKLQ